MSAGGSVTTGGFRRRPPKRSSISRLGWVVSALLVSVVGLARPSYPQWLIPSAELYPSDSDRLARFGMATDIDGDTIVVGAPEARDPLVTSGAVDIFERLAPGSNSWAFVARVSDPTGGTNQRFGITVSLDGSQLAVGGPNNFEPGRVLVFERNAGGPDAWGEIARLEAEPGVRGFGWKVALDGDTLAIAAELSLRWGVVVYERAGGTWSRVATLWPPPGTGRPGLTTLALDGDVLALGHLGHGVETGKIHMFERSNGSWFHVASLTSPNSASHDHFGFSVALDGHTVVAGAPAENSPVRGAVYVFDRTDGSWLFSQRLTTDDADPYPSSAQFGFSVALEGNRLSIGSPPFGVCVIFCDIRPGRLYEFRRARGGSFSKVDTIQDGEIPGLKEIPRGLYGNLAVSSGTVVAGVDYSGSVAVVYQREPSVLEIPTLEVRWLFVLALLVGLAGVWGLRRERQPGAG